MTITLAERWEDNCERHGHLGQKLTKSHLSETPFKTLEDVKDPEGGDNDTRVRGHDVPFPSMAVMDVSIPELSTLPSASPEELIAGLYRGLAVDPATLTRRMYQRELEAARDLVAKGATPAEAETYARETNVPGRRAAVDMNSFEHDRASWQSRHQRVLAPAVMRVANGRIPE